MSRIESESEAVMAALCREYVEPFKTIVRFLEHNENLRNFQRRRKQPNPCFGSTEYIDWLATKYISGRARREVPLPKTVPDPALGVVLNTCYQVEPSDLEMQIAGHSLAMLAENIIGDLLERYIDSELGDELIWCPGEVVRSVDFIRDEGEGNWLALQIKNRNNSENSSSSRVREGTEIMKWHRSESKKLKMHWDDFPIKADGVTLSEEGFQKFISDYFSQV